MPLSDCQTRVLQHRAALLIVVGRNFAGWFHAHLSFLSFLLIHHNILSWRVS
jgi:hypothetical protein